MSMSPLKITIEMSPTHAYTWLAKLEWICLWSNDIWNVDSNMKLRGIMANQCT